MIMRVIDIETTGFSPPAEIWEIACVDLNQDGEDSGCFYALVLPGNGLDARTKELHRVNDDDLADQESWPEIQRDLHCLAAPGILVAHNVDFERQWLADIWPGVPWLCTYKSALRAWPDAPKYGNEDLRAWLGLQLDGNLAAHRADGDAFVTAEIFKRLLKIASVETMIAWTSEPRFMPRIPFGKHKGKPWKDLPKGYLAWLSEQTHLPRDVTSRASKELEDRKAGRLA